MATGGWASWCRSATYRPPGANEIAGVGGASMTGMTSAGGVAYGTGVLIATSMMAWAAAVRITGPAVAHWTPRRPLLRLDCMVSQSVCPPAPLDPTALAQSLRPFGESRMLP